MTYLDATIEFSDAVKEIEILVSYAKKNKTGARKYATFNKAALVLLCAKFETFLEGFLEEYAFCHLKQSSNKNINSEIFEHLVDNIIDQLEKFKLNKSKRKSHIKELVVLCGDDEINPIDFFSINSKLKLGKHGEGEVKRLLCTFGFKDFSETAQMQSFFKAFNSLNNIRNNIIHEDATPSLTHQDVEKYLFEITKFIQSIEQEALSKLNHIIHPTTASLPTAR